jgi:hypothetical protein
MANNQTRRVPPAILKADTDAFAALQAITNYSPANAVYAIPEITTLRQNMENARVAEAQAAAALAAARDVAVAREWDFHNAMLGVKTQVEAQFGPDSNELQSVGRKKKSERARPVRRSSGGQGTNP